MAPVINGVAWCIVGSINDVLVLAQQLTFRDNEEAVGIDAVAIQMDGDQTSPTSAPWKTLPIWPS